ncbi:hypothetical protein DFJ74DRAFT_650102 [Hyaloraphidium curvatum]|nr:hypothetical protein DFJ74DRAFT_650102 [Hyaloraphidium curvatum]
MSPTTTPTGWSSGSALCSTRTRLCFTSGTSGSRSAVLRPLRLTARQGCSTARSPRTQAHAPSKSQPCRRPGRKCANAGGPTHLKRTASPTCPLSCGSTGRKPSRPVPPRDRSGPAATSKKSPSASRQPTSPRAAPSMSLPTLATTPSPSTSSPTRRRPGSACSPWFGP